MKPHTPAPMAWLGHKTALSYVLLITLVMAATGLIALHEGATRFMLPFIVDDSSDLLGDQIAQARATPDLDTLSHVSEELAFLARATSVERMTESRLPDQSLYYTTMPPHNQLLLVSHILLGVFCLVVGGFQFWPQFRKRFMRVHRAFGALYVVTAPISVMLSLVYLALTPPHNIYAHLVAWCALWVFGILAIIAIVMAMRALSAKRIHEHQSWMALSFGCLIVAPMLRWNWVVLAWTFPHIDQETLNLVTMGIMLPEVLLIGYGLSLVNRQYLRALVRRKSAPLVPAINHAFFTAMPFWFGLAALVFAVSLTAYVFSDGILSLAPASLMPPALMERESGMLSEYGWLGPLFALANGTALFTGLWLLRQLFTRPQQPTSSRMVTTFAVATGLMLLASLAMGHHIGLQPNKGLLSGGTLYTLAGTLLAAFLLVFLGTWRVGQRALMKESLVFLLTLLPFPALLLGMLWAVNWVGLPADYLAAGQGYVLPAGGCLGLFFIAMFYVIYGQATREHG